MMIASLLTILVGPEDSALAKASKNNLAPRLDYHLIAQCCPSQIRQWHPSPSGFHGFRLFRVMRSFSKNLQEALCLMRDISPASILYSTGETWGLPVAFVGALQQQRCFTHIVYVHRVFSHGWLRFFRAFCNRLAVDGWICVTQYQVEMLSRALDSGGKPVVAISQGVDTTFFDPARASPPSRRPYVLAVGAEMRNYDLFFDAVRDLDVDVVVKASSAWMTTSRHGWASVPPNVEINTQRLSYVELRDLYAGAALVVAPLYDTPQAAGITTILEGMSMQKCVIATASSGLPDALIHDRTGIIVPASVEALQTAIETMWHDSEYREALAHAGQQHVRECFKLEDHATAVAEFLLRIAAQHH